MSAISLDNVCFRYADAWVLEDVSIRVHEGEFVGVIGPNGSGKTTLLRLMDGVIKPETGKIELEGAALESLGRRKIAQAIAVVPQESPDIFPFSVREIVLMGRAPHLPVFGFEGRKDMEVADRAMEMTGVLKLASRPIGSLSGGERQRALIARALAQQPRVMLLDEPTAFLDIRHQIAIFDLVSELRDREKLTVIAVTHDINLAALYSDRVILLNAGRVFSDGKPQDVITAANIESVYRTRIHVDSYPGTGLPRICPVRRTPSRH